MQSPYKYKFIGVGIFFYGGAFYCAVQLYLNDKLRAQLEEINKEGTRKYNLWQINERNAKSYDKTTNNYEFRTSVLKFRKRITSYAKGKVLETGIGTGRNMEFYQSDADVIGVDYSAKMIEQSISKLEELKAQNRIKANINLMKMDCEDLQFEDSYFDCVVDTYNLHNYYDYNLVIDNIKRVLKKDGYLLIIANGQSYYRIINDFYVLFKPYFFMKRGINLLSNLIS